MTTEKNPEAGGLGVRAEGAGSEIDVSMLTQLTEPEAARLTELRREQHALRCHVEAYESYRGDV